MKTKAVLVNKTLKILNAAGEELSFAKDGVDFEATAQLYGHDSLKFTAYQMSGIVINKNHNWEQPETRIDTAETFLRMVAAHLGYAVVKKDGPRPTDNGEDVYEITTPTKRLRCSDI